VQFCLVGRLATAQAEEVLGGQQIDDGADIDHQHGDAQQGDLLRQFVDLERQEQGRRDDSEVFPPTLHLPQSDTFCDLQSTVEQQRRRNEGERRAFGVDGLLDRMDEAGVLRVPADLVEERFERAEIAVHDIAHAHLTRFELQHGDSQQHDDQTAHETLDRQQAQDECRAQRLAAQQHRCVIGWTVT